MKKKMVFNESGKEGASFRDSFSKADESPEQKRRQAGKMPGLRQKMATQIEGKLKLKPGGCEEKSVDTLNQDSGQCGRQRSIAEDVDQETTFFELDAHARELRQIDRQLEAVHK